MAIAWACPCGMGFNTASESAGQQILCPGCGRLNQVPQPWPALEITSVEEEVIEVAPAEDEIPEVDVDVEEEPSVPAEDDDTSYAAKQAAAGNHAWTAIGSIKLVETAHCVAFGPAGAYGLAGQDDDILVLNLHKGKKLDRFGGHEGLVTCVAISMGGDFAVSGDEQGDVLYWEVSTRQKLQSFRVHDSVITAAAIAPNHSLAATGDREGLIKLWGLADGVDERLRDATWSEKVTALIFSADSAYLAAAGNKGRVSIWSVKTRELVQRFRMPGALVSLQFAGKSDALLGVARPAVANLPTNPEVWQFDPKTGQAKECFRPTGVPRTFPYGVLLTPGGKRLLSVGRARGDIEYRQGADILEVWSLATSQRLHAFTKLGGDVECLAITPNGTRVLLANDRRQLKVFALAERDT